MISDHELELSTSRPNADAVRSRFARALSDMYRQEVPQYSELVRLVAMVNESALDEDPAMRSHLHANGDLDGLRVERHGAVRVGTSRELHTLRRMFAVMGMEPVGYYDLSGAGVPVHSTAFRPVSESSLRACPLRVFTSLIRVDLVEDPALRQQIEGILARRSIFHPRAIDLIEQWEATGELSSSEADDFVGAALETFRWHSEARVDASIYDTLIRAHRLLADVVCFYGPHINHLTLRSLDIDAAQVAMQGNGLLAKDVVEGPPRRRCPILLRQTSFKAISEPVRFLDGRTGAHTARFGEIEQRGLALTRKGRELYDRLLAEARCDANAADGHGGYAAQLARAFAAFPDSHDELRSQGLGFYRYALTDAGRALAGDAEFDLVVWLQNGWVVAEPIEYQDFLPVSAAGIFQSNLGDVGRHQYLAHSARNEFEAALGASVVDEISLYEAAERDSLAEVREALAGAMT